MRSSALQNWDGNPFERRTRKRSTSFRLRVSKVEFSEFDAAPAGFSTLSDFLERVVDGETAERLPHARRQFSSERLSEGKSKARLSDLRLQAGMTQKQLAQEIGTSQPRLSLWEAGLDRPSFDNIQKMSVILSVDYNSLMAAIAND